MIKISDLEYLKSITGPKGWVDNPADMQAFVTEERDKYRGKSPLVLLPRSVDEVSQILKFCNEKSIETVPQGGNTGLVGGGIPTADNSQIILSLKRMDSVISHDISAHTITVGAGMILGNLQQIAAQESQLFPVSLAAEGSCQIGGNIATNAGGVNVLRYGSMRDQVLGLQVVLPNGEVIDDLSGLRKDNTGYNLKALFMGSEGTLGIITAATLKLYPAHRQKELAFVAVESPEKAVELFSLARKMSGDSLIAFEIMPHIGLEFVIDHMGGRNPFGAGNTGGAENTGRNAYEWYILLECATSFDEGILDLPRLMGLIVTEGFESGLIIDGVLPKNQKETDEIWALRENLSEAQKYEGGSIKHDISVPISKIPEFLEKATAAVTSEVPNLRPVPFGHIGDGNLHFNLSQPIGADKADFLSKWEKLNEITHEITLQLGGSISAEHGIGRLKVEELERHKSPVMLDQMRNIKKAIDPKGIMNPNIIFKIK
jgi:D-lactate dehydrogenase (cytochrome)